MEETREQKLLAQAQQKDLELDLIQHCTKISQGLDKLAPNSGDRAIWELVQNARDLSNDCHIRMMLAGDEFVFAHQGEPFTYETLTSLIKQVSSTEKQYRELNDDGLPKVGQYGTGFLTTHAFSRIIVLKGSMEVSLDGEVGKTYVDLEDDQESGFVIDREFSNIKEFVDKMKRQILKAQSLLCRIGEESPKEWTELHYHLNREARIKAEKALEQAKMLMPFVMAFNPRIKEVVVDSDGATGCNRTYRRLSTEYLEVCNNRVMKATIGVSGQDSKEVYCLCSNNDEDMVIIPPTELPMSDNMPSLFLYYPLLGTEDFGTNFVFHSNSFTAKEERDGIMLPSGNENARPKFEKNAEVLNRMTDMLLGFLTNNVFPRYSLYGREELARIYFPCAGNKEPEQDAFFTALKKKYVSCFEKLPLLSVNGEKVSISSGRVKVFHPSLYESLTEDQICRYIDVLREYAAMAYPIPEEKPLEWARIIAEWGTRKDEYFITYQDICNSIKDKSGRLLDFLNLLTEAGQTELLMKNDIIPNRKGVLCSGNSLRNGETITDQLYRIAEPLMGEKADKLIDPAFKNVVTLDEYKRKDLRDDVTTWLGGKKTDTIDKGIAFPEDLLHAIIVYCSHYQSQNLASFRNKIMPYICELYAVKYSEQVLPQTEEEKIVNLDLYETPFGYLVESALLTISGKNETWVAAHGELLRNIMERYMEMSESRWTEKLKKYAVFPNQNCKLCLLEKLKKKGEGIDNELIKIYQDLFGKDLRDCWIDENFAGFCSIDTQQARSISGEIQNQLETVQYKDVIVLDIIELLEKDHWKQLGLFESISAQKEKLRYGFTTAEQRKHINRIIKAKNDNLLMAFANIAENNNAELVVEMTKKTIEVAERQEYINKLGNYVESHLYAYLKKVLDPLGIHIVDVQGGQDYILSKDGFEDYRVEVKSRWSIDKSVEMSKLQFETAVANADRFALVMANMEDFSKWRVEKNDPLTDSDLVDRLKIIDNIGNNADLLNRVNEAFKGGDNDVKAEGYYAIRVPQIVFTNRGLFLPGFIEIIKSKFERR